MAMTFDRLWVLLILPCVLFGQQRTTARPASSTHPTQTTKQRETAEQKKTKEFLGSRIAYAKLLTEYFAKIGRQTIHVNAVDENQQTLDIYSAAIGKPFGGETKNLLDAREVIQSADSIAMLKKCRFKKVIIRGNDYTEGYMVP
jgi:hypothetical protein